MPVATYEPLATTTLSTNTATVTFSSISSAYTDLVVVVASRSAQSTTDRDLFVRFNSDSGANYSRVRLLGNGTTSVGSLTTSSNHAIVGAMPADTYAGGSSAFDPTVLNIFNYSNSTTYKPMLARGGPARIAAQATIHIWRNTNAINSITFIPENNDFVTGSIFSLYGIKAA